MAGEGGAYSLSLNKTKVKSLASGSYTFWKDDGSMIGYSSRPVDGVTSFQKCLSACDLDGACAAVVMTGMTTAQSAPASCSKVYGYSGIAVFKRSMTKTVVTRLRLEDVLPAV